MNIVVDANIVFSALLNTDSTVADLLLNSAGIFTFRTCDLLRAELVRHEARLLHLSGYFATQLADIQHHVFRPLTFVAEDQIPFAFWQQAAPLVREVDMDDIAFVALTDFLSAHLWTGDRKLLHGRYPEFFANDSLRRIGSVVYNTRRHRIAYLLPPDSLAGHPKAEVTSRWLSLDPLARKYPGISPYAYVANSPLIYIDPDGRIIVPIGVKAVAAMTQFRDNTAKSNNREAMAVLAKQDARNVQYFVSIYMDASNSGHQNASKMLGGITTLNQTLENAFDILIKFNLYLIIKMLAYKLQTAYQFENGGIRFETVEGVPGAGVIAYDLQDEVDTKVAATRAIMDDGKTLESGKENSAKIDNPKKYASLPIMEKIEKGTATDTDSKALGKAYRKDLSGSTMPGERTTVSEAAANLPSGSTVVSAKGGKMQKETKK